MMNKLKPAEKPKAIDTVVITCMDHRYQETIRQILIDKHGIDVDQVDRLAVGGSSKAVADETLIPSLKIAYEKHGSRNVYIFDHIDCGGFGGLAAFDDSVQKEAEAHFESLNKAKDIISAELPETVVVLCLVGLDGELIPVPTKQ